MNKYSVGIDGYNLSLAHGTGISTYARTLTSTISSLGHPVIGVFGIDAGTDSDLQEFLFFDRLARPKKRAKGLLGALRRRIESRHMRPIADIRLQNVDKHPIQNDFPNFDRIVSSSGLFETAYRHLRRRGEFLTLSFPDPPAIMHWTYPLPIRLEGARNIFTIHDLVPLRMPYMTLDDKKSYYKVIKGCIAVADQICTVSKASERDIITMFPEARDKIFTTYQTTDIHDRLDDRIGEEAIVSSLGLNVDGYFLFFGALEPKKNVVRLVEAYLRLGTSTPLVIISGRSWRSDAESSILNAIDKSKSQLRVLDYVPKTILHALVRHARAVTFPSLYEGFGLPVYEAMYLGTPVLTSDTGGLREVAGDAAILVDPYDVSSIQQGLAKLDQSAPLRETLRQLGLKQAKNFSVAQYRNAIHAMYEKVIG